jgi:hypothetical protein
MKESSLFDSLPEESRKPSGPVTCLGLSFENDAARRAYFTEKLRKKLQDPEFRKIEGFPVGEDEAILALSDPPYYTACPNPWIADFVGHYGKAYDPSAEYSREPLAVDVSVGKTDAIYKAHSYHTKVPHLAIVPSILHYTEPGDIVLDGFAGSGMTGVAAQCCGTAPDSYRVALEQAWEQEGRTAPKWGARRAVLNDLSPAATFIAANYNIPFDVRDFAEAGKKMLKEMEQEIGWMYETLHSDGKNKAQIDYTVWSQLYSCPDCVGEINFTNEALDEDSKRVKEEFPCPHCNAMLSKTRLKRLYTTQLDPGTGKQIQVPVRAPALVAYRIGKQRYEKKPTAADLEVIHHIEALPLSSQVPKNEIPPMHMTHERARMDYSGITHVHHFYLPRAAQAMGLLWAKAKAHPDARTRNFLLFMVEQAIWGLSVLNRYGPTHFSQVNRMLTGVYYVASQHSECSPWYIFAGKLDRLVKTFGDFGSVAGDIAIGTGTAAKLPLADNSIDYIFTDPPFGENIYYADLNFLVEAWHGVTTDAKPEAIIDKFKNKALPDYQRLMQHCFAEYHRVLKPGHWMTVVFSNSKAAVWNAIQVALQQAGFVVAEVTALDKVQGSYRQVTSTTAVKQDLVISTYKPNGGLEDRLQKGGATEESAWDFVQTHLRQLSVTKVINDELEFVIERDPRRIYDRMVAWFVRHNALVPLSNDEFQIGMRNRFPERDGMAFLPEQVTEYDKKRAQTAQAPQIELFVCDERSAIDWVHDFLKERPSSYQDIHPAFIKQLGAYSKNETMLELSTLLEQNFLCYDGKGSIPAQIASWMMKSSTLRELIATNCEKEDSGALSTTHPVLLREAENRWYVPDPNKASDLEKLRERALLKEFKIYVERKTRFKRNEPFRLEAVRAGFKNAWQNQDYAVIVAVAEKIPSKILEEDPKLLMWYDQAVTRIGGE